MRTESGSPIGIQVKSGTGSFAEAVASCTMGWQGLSRAKESMYWQRAARAAVLDSDIACSDQPHVRLVVSANGFSNHAIKAARDHNELHPESAILPCTVEDSLFGPLASTI